MSQRTQGCHVQNGLVSDASRLLDLGGLAVGWIASDAFGGRVVHLVTADQTGLPQFVGIFGVSSGCLACSKA